MLYKNTTTVSWERFVQDLYRWMGISQPIIKKLWHTPNDESNLKHSARKLSPNQMVEEYQFHQLLPGEKLDDISKRFVDFLDEKLCWEEFQRNSTYVSRSSPNVVSLSLLDWTEELFIRTTTEVYWGKTIWKVAPNLINAFLRWESTTWKYVFQLPRFLSKDMYTAKDQLVDAFSTYFEKPREERNDANYFVSAAEDKLRITGLETQDIARVHMLQFWA